MIKKRLDNVNNELFYLCSSTKKNDTILFLHPAFSDHKALLPQLEYFSKEYNVIAPDLIGHGESQTMLNNTTIEASAKHIAEILNKENIGATHIVGVSMGALVAQYFALLYPFRIKSLTAIGGYYIHVKDDSVAKAQRKSNSSLILKALFSMKAFRKAVTKITCYTEKGKELFYESTLLYSRKSLRVMQGFAKIIDDRQDYECNYPLQILTGQHDIVLAHKMAKDWHKILPNAKNEVIPEAGHCANLDQPEIVNQKIEELIRE